MPNAPCCTHRVIFYQQCGHYKNAIDHGNSECTSFQLPPPPLESEIPSSPQSALRRTVKNKIRKWQRNAEEKLKALMKGKGETEVENNTSLPLPEGLLLLKLSGVAVELPLLGKNCKRLKIDIRDSTDSLCDYCSHTLGDSVQFFTNEEVEKLKTIWQTTKELWLQKYWDEYKRRWYVSFEKFNSSQPQQALPFKERVFVFDVEVDSSPFLAVTDENAIPEDDLCPICQEILADVFYDGKPRQTPCRHTFHLECITPWFQDNDTCPYCRTKYKILRPFFVNANSTHKIGFNFEHSLANLLAIADRRDND